MREHLSCARRRVGHRGTTERPALYLSEAGSSEPHRGAPRPNHGSRLIQGSHRILVGLFPKTISRTHNGDDWAKQFATCANLQSSG